MRIVLTAFCLLAVTACAANGPIGPTVPLDEQFTLARGEVAAIDGTGVRVQFRGVTGDSRCPADAICIQGGDAIVHVRVFDGGGAADYELHTGDSARAAAAHGLLRIALLELQPYPFSNRTIPQDEYRATLRVTRP